MFEREEKKMSVVRATQEKEKRKKKKFELLENNQWLYGRLVYRSNEYGKFYVIRSQRVRKNLSYNFIRTKEGLQKKNVKENDKRFS
jgi:hypothetical protein